MRMTFNFVVLDDLNDILIKYQTCLLRLQRSLNLHGVRLYVCTMHLILQIWNSSTNQTVSLSRVWRRTSHPFVPWISHSFHCGRSSRCRQRSWCLVGLSWTAVQKGAPGSVCSTPFMPWALLSRHRRELWCGCLKLMFSEGYSPLPIQMECLQKAVAVATLPGTWAEPNLFCIRSNLDFKKCSLEAAPEGNRHALSALQSNFTRDL